jgi:hypothetical protein
LRDSYELGLAPPHLASQGGDELSLGTPPYGAALPLKPVGAVMHADSMTAPTTPAEWLGINNRDSLFLHDDTSNSIFRGQRGYKVLVGVISDVHMHLPVNDISFVT